jgi:hypothetical protein
MDGEFEIAVAHDVNVVFPFEFPRDANGFDLSV